MKISFFFQELQKVNKDANSWKILSSLGFGVVFTCVERFSGLLADSNVFVAICFHSGFYNLGYS